MLAIGVCTLGLFAGGIYWMSQVQNPANVEVAIEKLITPESQSIGPATAPVTLVEFGDYQCPSCSTANPAIKALIAQYPDKIRFVFRHFPLTQHQHATLAAQAAEAAGAQGKYWEMHNWLYEHQAEWSANANPLALFSGAATTLGLDVTAFNQAIQNKTHSGRIQQGLSDGMSIGVDSTPSFYLNGKPFQGSMAQLKTTIEERIRSSAQ